MPVVTPAMLGAEIVRQARAFTHLREIVPNAKWDDPRTPAWEKALNDQLVVTMKEDGWEPGQPYCIAFVWCAVVLAMRRLGVYPDKIARFKRLICPHVMASVNAFRDTGLLSDTAILPGSIWLCQSGKSASGHAGIVVDRSRIISSMMMTLEGNTSVGATNDERERNGDGIYERTRDVKVNGRLITRGFVCPAALLS